MCYYLCCMTHIIVTDRTAQDKLQQLNDLLAQAGALARELGQAIQGPTVLRPSDALKATEAEVDAAIDRGEYADFAGIEGLLIDLHARV